MNRHSLRAGLLPADTRNCTSVAPVIGAGAGPPALEAAATMICWRDDLVLARPQMPGATMKENSDVYG